MHQVKIQKITVGKRSVFLWVDIKPRDIHIPKEAHHVVFVSRYHAKHLKALLLILFIGSCQLVSIAALR